MLAEHRTENVKAEWPWELLNCWDRSPRLASRWLPPGFFSLLSLCPSFLAYTTLPALSGACVCLKVSLPEEGCQSLSTKDAQLGGPANPRPQASPQVAVSDQVAALGQRSMEQ